MGSSYRGLQQVASFRPYTSKQVGDTGPAESTRRGNLQRVWSSFSGLAGQGGTHSLAVEEEPIQTNEAATLQILKIFSLEKSCFK